MTPLQILETAISGGAVPRIPIFCNLLDQGARELGMPPREYYANGEHVASAQLQMRARYGYDNVWGLFYVGKEAELLGCRDILYSDNGAPNVVDFVIKHYDDIARLEIPPDITTHPAWMEIAKCMAILKNEAGGRYPICAYITASASLPAILMGMDNWMELCLMGPPDVRDELLRKCSLFVRQQVAAYRAAGADVLLYSNPFGATSMLGSKRFQQWVMPWMKQDLIPGEAPDLVYYTGMAPINDVLAQVKHELGITNFSIGPLADVQQAKQLLGEHGLICGAIEDIRLVHYSPQQTREAVRRLCELGKVGGHFLLTTGLMPMAIPEANIRAMLDAAFEFGTY